MYYYSFYFFELLNYLDTIQVVFNDDTNLTCISNNLILEGHIFQDNNIIEDCFFFPNKLVHIFRDNDSQEYDIKHNKKDS